MKFERDQAGRIRIQGVTYVSNALHGHPEIGAASVPLWVKQRQPENLLPVDPFKTLTELQPTLAPRDLGDTAMGGGATRSRPRL